MFSVDPNIRQTTDETPGGSQSVSFSWSDETTRLLLNQYKMNESMFSSPHLKKKQVWEKIANSFKSYGYSVTPLQCENKFKSLKNNYKIIKDNNNKSGSSRRKCRYMAELDEIFEKDPAVQPVSGSSRRKCRYMAELDEIFEKDPAIQPISLASSSSGFNNSVMVTENENNTTQETPSPKASAKKKCRKEEEPEWFKNYRISVEKRHEEN
ncbi:zinc finger and SCAN domain-containing protein 29-like, partial [Centruroides sculpturatus]|uniref:zinc finger and SCAN domain-containing protein 29-like n=1 Tax=Centruroides sculpturatus TaxID=218467 RepID=UPI000C6CD461